MVFGSESAVRAGLDKGRSLRLEGAVSVLPLGGRAASLGAAPPRRLARRVSILRRAVTVDLARAAATYDWVGGCFNATAAAANGRRAASAGSVRGHAHAAGGSSSGVRAAAT